jgi:hypothetical protein
VLPVVGLAQCLSIGRPGNHSVSGWQERRRLWVSWTQSLRELMHISFSAGPESGPYYG